jgi:tetratricopeptide (TPR) repeat protein
MLRDLPRAAACFEQQLDLARAIGDRRSEGNAASNLGNVYAALGEPDRAKEFYAQRLVIALEIGDRRGEAIGSWNLGLIYEQAGNLAQAVNHMQTRVAYEQEIGHPDAAAYARHVDQLRAQLAAADAAGN